ncbi:uncharacterized protein HMPREF1541_04586 [Cyphellophora europaea CBS 101466]|uniref:Origin recognition complex subunit 2 n=1 Tax=Cyphellophora europaea (strain CBS 101466) TaxID=1220924 RepID=W2RVG9_CYPE1|nr:uncharacterized protein HMPREF1541_04586 [Cyphellophora europaea CBS 101466]ETN40310.1 hypothetical protein HMPREF1541_04586 [Cyphellophora europaea CBS 101466]
MAKRQQDDAVSTPSKRLRRPTPKKAYVEDSDPDSNDLSTDENATPSKRTVARKTGDSATPRPNGTTLFATPSGGTIQTPSKARRADQSAKRKSARALADVQDEDDWEGNNALAREILNDERAEARQSVEAGDTTPAATPSKRGRGRPPGAKNKRSPTPEGDIAPEERYFFQNRMGPLRISNNAFSKVKPLTHEEYFENTRQLGESHKVEKEFLMKLHARAFTQWDLELSEGYSVCLYGYGSKAVLVNRFATWLYNHSSPRARIVVVNGYAPKLNIRTILNTIGSAIVGNEKDLKLTGQPQDMLETLFERLEEAAPEGPLYVLVNSIDSPSLRKSSTQAVLARLASHRLVRLVGTADSPTLPLLWNSTLLDKYNFVFHDCTTFAPYKVELSVVDDVNELLGRKGRRAGGQEGIKYVLQSLPPNAQKLYHILISEILSILAGDFDAEEEDDVGGSRGKPMQDLAEETGVEYRLLYDKACDAFICTSEMNFRFLLKEFHDHQMITSKRDAAGTEMMCVPLGREEMQGLLQDLVSLD